MVENEDQAKELCVKYGIKLSEHKTVIVTGNNSIYLSDNIDPADTSKKFFLKGGTISIEAEKEEKIEEPKNLSDSEIEEQIIEEEKEEKAKDKKSKK
jgi:hypothetical protein